MADSGKKSYGSTDTAKLSSNVVEKLQKRPSTTGRTLNLEGAPANRSTHNSDFVRRTSESRQLNHEDLDYAQKIEKKRSFHSEEAIGEIHDQIDDVKDTFVYNYEGLTTAKAEELLKISFVFLNCVASQDKT